MFANKIFLVTTLAFLLAGLRSNAYAQLPGKASQIPQTAMLLVDQEEESEGISGEVIVKTAMQYLGVPYRKGKSSPKGFDCSGFTSYIFKQFSIVLNRDSRSQFTQGTPIKQVADLRAGDLVFWKGSNSKSTAVGHVGIVTEVSESTGSFKFVHASLSGGIRVDDSREAYYTKRYVGARRILRGESFDEPESVQTTN